MNEIIRSKQICLYYLADSDNSIVFPGVTCYDLIAGVVYTCSNFRLEHGGTGIMKSIKLWAGILGIVIAVYILLISCYEAAWNVLTMSGHINGVIGIIIAGLLMAGSIVRIGMRKAEDDSGSIISLVLFAVASAIAFALTPIYRYMQTWAIVCLVMGIISVLMIMWKNSRIGQ